MSAIGRPETTGRLLSFNSYSTNIIEVVDHIERRRCRIQSVDNVDPMETPVERFHFPVDRGVSITTNGLSLPYAVAVPIRNHAGFMIDQLTSGDNQNFSYDQYRLELSTPIKLYISFSSIFEIKVTSRRVEIKFESPTEVFLGARSHHKQPAGRITTPRDPEVMMEAVSHLSSALKTTTCERSYPTLRGHPPEVTLGDELYIPDIIEKPETGIKVEIPANYRSIYIASPLAYYLGAELTPGDSYNIKTQHGFSYSLDDANIGIEEKVQRVLKKCFFLDCLTRTEGYYKISLHERKQLEEDLSIDFKSMYDRALPEQIPTYLGIEYEKIKTYIPKWKQTAYIQVGPDKVEALPFLIHELSSIHSDKRTNVDENNVKKVEYSTQSSVNRSPHFRTHDSIRERRVDFRSNNKPHMSEKRVELPENDSLERVWVGDGIPVEATKSIPEAFRNRIKRDPTDGNIEISVVVNDSNMLNEGEVVDRVYGTREQLEFSVDVHREMTVNELQGMLKKDIEFLHYIGHIDDGGFECIDGQLDATELDNVGVDSFLLNACSSYQQAIELIDAGAIAGIATTKPVLNSGAERIGESVARLLNLGFPLVAALEISKSKSIMGDSYVIIGDGCLDLTQPESGIPSSCELRKKGDSFDVTYNTYLTRKRGIGSITMPYMGGNEDFYLTSGSTGEFTANISELMRFLSEENIPVKLDSKLYWSNRISVQELVDS
jgi:hypothetical protein